MMAWASCEASELGILGDLKLGWRAVAASSAALTWLKHKVERLEDRQD